MNKPASLSGLWLLAVRVSLRLSPNSLLPQCPLWLARFGVAIPWLLSQSLPLAPRVSLFPSLFVSSYLRHPFPPPLFFILHAFSLSFFILTPPSPPPAPFSSHTERCTNTIPHISNEYLVIILSPQRLSVWLRLSSDSVTNGTASFSTAAIPQHWQTEMRCGSTNTAQRDCRLMPQSDLHILQRPF